MKRYSKKSFPAYIFVPGKNPHPKKAGGHSEGEADPVAPPLNENEPATSEFLRYSLDLYHFGYYWEAHVYLEALWNAQGRKGMVADFLKGIIKLCAAGVKLELGQVSSARGHLERARELLSEVIQEKGGHFLGFSLEEIIREIDRSLETGVKCPPLYPSWE